MASAQAGPQLPQARSKRVRRAIHIRSLLRRLGKPHIHVPTALWIALLGALLSVWILPAITRQWDDRQKAHELKARLVQDIAMAPVDMPVTPEWRFGELVYRRRTPAEIAASLHAFSRPERRIEAELNAYFPSQGPTVSPPVAKWFDYATAVYAYYDAERLLVWPETDNADVSARKSRLKEDFKDILVSGGTAREWVNDYSPWRLHARTRRILNVEALTHLAGAVRWKEWLATEQVLSSKPEGYSTTTSDLIHDLLPW